MVHFVRMTKCAKGQDTDDTVISVVYVALNKLTGVLYALPDAFRSTTHGPKRVHNQCACGLKACRGGLPPPPR